MNTIATRLARHGDLEAVAVLFDAYRQFYEQPADLPLAHRYVTDRFMNKESVLIVAEDRVAMLVGFTQLYPAFCSVRAAHTYVLYDLFVNPAARGTGAGRALMMAAEAHARKEGAARMELSTARTNKIGQSLYESVGWKRDDTFLVYGKDLHD